MPIKIDYSPVGPLLGLAYAAGEGERRRRGEATDLAFVQMSLAAQARNAQIAAQIQAQDQAFALQQAAAARMAGTPTRVQPSDSVLGRMQWQGEQRGLQREEQLRQLDEMLASGDITQKQFRQAELGIKTNNEALVREALVPKVKPPLAATTAVKHIEQRNQRRIERQLAVEERKSKLDPYADPEQEKVRVDLAQKRIKELEAELQASYQREDVVFGLGPHQIAPRKQLTSAEERAIADMYLAEAGGDVEVAKRLYAERRGQ